MSVPQIVTTSAPLTRVQLPEDLRAVALTPQDPFYRDHAPTFFRGGAPAVILQAQDAKHVRSTVLLAAKHPVPLENRVPALTWVFPILRRLAHTR
jgi:hypothetical protein